VPPSRGCHGHVRRHVVVTTRVRRRAVAMVTELCELTGYCLAETQQGPHEERLIDDIFQKRKYQPLARPVAKESDLVNVFLGISLQQIVDVVSTDTRNVVAMATGVSPAACLPRSILHGISIPSAIHAPKLSRVTKLNCTIGRFPAKL